MHAFYTKCALGRISADDKDEFVKAYLEEFDELYKTGEAHDKPTTWRERFARGYKERQR